MLQYINSDVLLRRVMEDAASFSSAAPFKHIVFDDILRPGCEQLMSGTFPGREWPGWDNSDHQYQRSKSSCSSVHKMPFPLDRVVMELNSGEVVRWLEKLTGINNLLPDPHLEGGGLHTSFEGGYLIPHTDFHRTPLENYFRRLNLLLYLNENWKSENGGNLELWDKKRDVVAKEVVPVLGKCVVFQTDDQSVHGFSTPISKRSQRNSIAMYYYTSTPPERFSGDGNTYWRVKSLGGKADQTWTSIQRRRFFLGVTRVASSISWRAARAASRESGKSRPSDGRE
jgi:hypothetical protein